VKIILATNVIKPTQERFKKELQKDEWVTIRLENSHCFLICSSESKEEASHIALRGNTMFHQKEPLYESLATMLSLEISKNEMLKWFMVLRFINLLNIH